MEGFLLLRGEKRRSGSCAAGQPHRMKKGKPVGIFVCLQGSFVHEAANGKVRHEQTKELLLYQFRRLAA